MYMTAEEFREKNFTENSRPGISTIRNWIKRGQLPGKKFGGLYYVKVDEAESIPEPEQTPDFSMYT